MEISGVAFRPIQNFSGDLLNTHSSKPSFSGRLVTAGNWVSGDLRLSCSRNLNSTGFLHSGYWKNRNLQCYVPPVCGGKKKEMVKEEKKREKKEIKKKMKLVKGLWKNLSVYSDQMGFLDIKDGSNDGNEQGEIMSRASEILLAQLLQLRAEEKELKRKQKEEKAKLNASITSESVCGEVINVSSEKGSSAVLELPTEKKVVDEVNVVIQEQTTTPTNSNLSTGQKRVTEEEHILLNSDKSCCSSITGSSMNSDGSVVIGTPSIGERSKINVCMGGKCKKMGSEALLEELKNKVGMEGLVVGCKCMGKCRNAPNVKVVSQSSDINLSQGNDNSSFVRSLSQPSNKSLYLGVGLEDVGTIVANFLGEESRKDLGLVTA